MQQLEWEVPQSVDPNYVEDFQKEVAVVQGLRTLFVGKLADYWPTVLGLKGT